MKETMDPTPVRPTADEENFANRKLIRSGIAARGSQPRNHNVEP